MSRRGRAQSVWRSWRSTAQRHVLPSGTRSSEEPKGSSEPARSGLSSKPNLKRFRLQGAACRAMAKVTSTEMLTVIWPGLMGTSLPPPMPKPA